jgi:hypothetical protein
MNSISLCTFVKLIIKIYIMKKLLFSLFAVSTLGFASAQLADGSAAPNFTTTDINGNSHTLQDYLDQGKTVILDISAVWCGPCWNYHLAGVLKDLWYTHGPDGSDEIMILKVEGDASTPASSLYGGGNSQGDWVTGTPYPIIDDAAIASLYEITYYPTIYRICPDGTTYLAGQLSAANHLAGINSNCGNTLSNGVANHASLNDGSLALCGDGSVDVQVSFKNYGNNAITSGTVLLFENGTQIASTNITGSTAAGATGMVTFTGVNANASNTYTAEMTDLNGGAPFNSNIVNASLSVTQAELVSFDIKVLVHTDNYPGEISWEIRNGANALVASGGPYQPGTNDQWGGGGPDAMTTKTHEVTLPNIEDCYTIVCKDSYGDGWSLSSQNEPGISIRSNGQIVFNAEVGNFGNELSLKNAVRTDATSGIEALEMETLSIYPNPATDLLNIDFTAGNETYEVSITDMQGRTIATQVVEGNGSQTHLEFNTSGFTAGAYLVVISSESNTITNRVIVK